eukprot:PhM_4_TR8498/c0_g1_i1/m.21986
MDSDSDSFDGNNHYSRYHHHLDDDEDENSNNNHLHGHNNTVGATGPSLNLDAIDMQLQSTSCPPLPSDADEALRDLALGDNVPPLNRGALSTTQGRHHNLALNLFEMSRGLISKEVALELLSRCVREGNVRPPEIDHAVQQNQEFHQNPDIQLEGGGAVPVLTPFEAFVSAPHNRRWLIRSLKNAAAANSSSSGGTTATLYPALAQTMWECAPAEERAAWHSVGFA